MRCMCYSLTENTRRFYEIRRPLMKRPIAMLLALLLTAGLFAFVSCGDGKNYTVK